MDVGLLQKDVAESIGITEDCVTNWENNKTEPMVHFYPAIISFLGGYPFKTETLGEKLLMTRKVCGLSQKQMGKIVGVDETTVARYETDRSTPPDMVLQLYHSYACV